MSQPLTPPEDGGGSGGDRAVLCLEQGLEQVIAQPRGGGSGRPLDSFIQLVFQTQKFTLISNPDAAKRSREKNGLLFLITFRRI